MTSKLVKDAINNVRKERKFLVLQNAQGQKFILKDFQPSASVCYPNQIVPAFYDENGKPEMTSQSMVRAMHERGQLHYIYGSGDRKVLTNAILKRGKKIENFEIK